MSCWEWRRLPGLGPKYLVLIWCLEAERTGNSGGNRAFRSFPGVSLSRFERKVSISCSDWILGDLISLVGVI